MKLKYFLMAGLGLMVSGGLLAGQPMRLGRTEALLGKMALNWSK